jgi:hypothetical protein
MFQLQKSLQREICDFSMWPCHLQRDARDELMGIDQVELSQ